MTVKPSGTIRTVWAAALALAVAMASCGRSPTEPVPPVTMHRTVTVLVRDSLGAPAADAGVFWVARFDSADIGETRFSRSDDDGVALQVLAEGPWVVTVTASSARVAGASFVVAGEWRAAADTQVVRLVLHAASRLTGSATLAGRGEHSGTLVSSEAGVVAVTDSTGAWAMDGIPLGRWPLTMFHFGFAKGLTEAVVTIPGSVVVAPPVSMISSP
jgi:hypothetical protein